MDSVILKRGDRVVNHLKLLRCDSQNSCLDVCVDECQCGGVVKCKMDNAEGARTVMFAC